MTCDALSRAIRERRLQGSLGVIAEVKRRRFQGNDLLKGRSPADIARDYQAAGATAVSVVTSPWYGGDMQMLEAVVDADIRLPILRKDLIRTEKAIELSRAAGAAAVLLALPLLGLKRLIALLDAARENAVEPFVEVATRREIEELREVYDGVIAINNSDIKTNETSGSGISRSVQIIDRQDARLWVSASRIEGLQDVRQLVAAGFDGLLIGTHLLVADDIAARTRSIVTAARA